MPFTAATPVGDDYLSWGKLVMSWATHVDFLHGTRGVFGGPPGTQTPDTTAILYTLPAGAAGNFMPPGMPISVQFPPTVTEVVFVQDTATRRYIRLPDPAMVTAAFQGLQDGTLTYTLPPFYQAQPLNCADPNTFDITQKLTLQADRVGDYSIGSCA